MIFSWEAIALKRSADFIRNSDKDLNKNQCETLNSVEIK